MTKTRPLIICSFIILLIIVCAYLLIQNTFSSSDKSDLTYETLAGTWQKIDSSETIDFDSAYFYVTEADYEKIKQDKGNNIYYKIDDNMVSMFSSGGAHVNPVAYSYEPSSGILTLVDWRDKSKDEPLTNEKYIKSKD